jgi:hypothetical protein
MTDKEFCKIDTEFYGEVVDNIKQIKLRSFDGEELKEYVEHCIKLNLLTIPVVIVAKRTLCVCAEVHGTARNSENELVCKDCYEPLIA